MTTKVRLAMASVLLAATLGLLCASKAISGGPDKAVAEAITKLADAIKKGDADATKKLAAKAHAMKDIEELPDFMHLFKPRNKGGMGWGSNPGANPATDGLEKKIQEYAKNVKANEAADPNNEEAAYWMIAMAEIIKLKVPERDMAGGKTKNAWKELATETFDAAVAFRKAAATKNAKSIKNAAEKLSNTCSACHSKFK
jgi:hypothetical protein